MFWTSQRVISGPKNIAPNFLSIFAVKIPLLYEQDEQAFFRLQMAIKKTSVHRSMFAWEDWYLDDDSALFESQGNLSHSPLARSPADFSKARDIVPYQQQASQPYALTNYALRMWVPLHQFRGNLGKSPIYLAELTCYYEGDFSGTLEIYVRPIISDQSARDHIKRGSVVVDPARHYLLIPAPILLRKHALLLSSEDFDHHHGIIARLHSQAHGFEVAYVFPHDHWMKIRWRSAIILDPGQYSFMVFEGGRWDTVHIHHEPRRIKQAIWRLWIR
jgi:hypothetical protein